MQCWDPGGVEGIALMAIVGAAGVAAATVLVSRSEDGFTA